VYDKRRLVPFAEGWPGWLPLGLRAHLGHLSPARPPSAGELDSPQLPFELSLCWESSFSARSGDPSAGTLVNLANDGWYDDTPAAALALMMSRWRAIERRAWLVRAASTGVSAVSPGRPAAASLSVESARAAPLMRQPRNRLRARWHTPRSRVAALPCPGPPKSCPERGAARR
jgi:apolipoprotein N-acyltransferase